MAFPGIKIVRNRGRKPNVAGGRGMNSPVIRAIIFAARGLCFAPQKLAHSLREIHNVRRFLLSPIGEPLTHARNH